MFLVSPLLQDIFQQLPGHYEELFLPVLYSPDFDIFKRRMHRHCDICWNRPWGGCPDHNIGIFLTNDRELDIHGWIRNFRILNFGVSYRGFTSWAPVNDPKAFFKTQLLM